MEYGEMKSLTIFNTPVFKLGLFLLIACVLYVISLENYLLFRIIVDLFNVIIAYMVLIIVWKSKVISSLLSLQAEKLHDREILQSSEVFEAFKESQNRVTSMALIHEELYQGKDMETLEFSAYLRRLTGDLIKSYNSGNRKISLKLQLEQVYLGMDTAVPLGIIVNELVSNSLKHAFPAGEGGEVHISLFVLKDSNGEDESGPGCKNEASQESTLIVADNGTGIPEDLDIRNTDSLGLQLVNLLVEQVDGCIKLKKDSGTEFRILFRKQKNEISHLR